MTGFDEKRQIPEEQLVAYIDKALPEAERLEIEEALRSDPELAARLGELERGVKALSGPIDKLKEMVPSPESLESTLAAAMAQVAADTGSTDETVQTAETIPATQSPLTADAVASAEVASAEVDGDSPEVSSEADGETEATTASQTDQGAADTIGTLAEDAVGFAGDASALAGAVSGVTIETSAFADDVEDVADDTRDVAEDGGGAANDASGFAEEVSSVADDASDFADDIDDFADDVRGSADEDPEQEVEAFEEAQDLTEPPVEAFDDQAASDSESVTAESVFADPEPAEREPAESMVQDFAPESRMPPPLRRPGDRRQRDSRSRQGPGRPRKPSTRNPSTRAATGGQTSILGGMPFAVLAASVVAAFAIGVAIYPVTAPWLRPLTDPILARGPSGTSQPQAGADQAATPSSQRKWKRAIADYAVMYDRNTVLNQTVRPSDLFAELAHVEAGLGIPLRAETLNVAGFDLLGAELLNFNGKPLAKVTYRDPTGQPVLFCIIRSAPTGETVRPAVGAIEGLNTVTWDRDGYGYIVIGDANPTVVASLAEGLLPQYF